MILRDAFSSGHHGSDRMQRVEEAGCGLLSGAKSTVLRLPSQRVRVRGWLFVDLLMLCVVWRGWMCQEIF